MEKLCPECLPGYVNHTMQIIRESESLKMSNELLSTVGQSMGRGQFVGPGQKLETSGLTLQPLPDEDHGTITKSQIEPDKDDDVPTGHKTPIRWLLNTPQRDLVSAQTLQKHYGATVEETEYITARIDNIPSEARAAAIKALGWLDEEWLDGEIRRLLAECRQRKSVLGVTEVRPQNGQKICLGCGAVFVPSVPWHKYCSDRCSTRSRVTAHRKRLKLEPVTA
jgi:hypothetical protein